MHIFLTGEIQIGKSTVIRRVCQCLPDIRMVGFLTRKHQPDPTVPATVHILPVQGQHSCTEENRVGICQWAKDGSNAFPEVFDRCGTSLLNTADSAQLIIMDEIGKMERNAAAFSQRILNLLDGDRPILGVVRKEGNTPLLQAVRTHPNVRLMEVTEENREALVQEVLRLTKREVNRFIDSAGAIVLMNDTVLMVSERSGKWGFPKGHLEPGETARQASIREVFEETGIEITLSDHFAFECPSALPGEHRKVTFFLGSPTGGSLMPQADEVADAAWQDVSEVSTLLRFPTDIEPLLAALDFRKTLL